MVNSALGLNNEKAEVPHSGSCLFGFYGGGGANICSFKDVKKILVMINVPFQEYNFYQT